MQPAAARALFDAFERLEWKDRVRTEHSWTCCASCGANEMAEELREQPGEFDGGCFYHDQDVDTAIATGRLYVRFGAYAADHDGTDDTMDVDIGRRIVGELQLRGFVPEWDGTSSTCIIVDLRDWSQQRCATKATF